MHLTAHIHAHISFSRQKNGGMVSVANMPSTTSEDDNLRGPLVAPYDEQGCESRYILLYIKLLYIALY